MEPAEKRNRKKKKEKRKKKTLRKQTNKSQNKNVRQDYTTLSLSLPRVSRGHRGGTYTHVPWLRPVVLSGRRRRRAGSVPCRSHAGMDEGWVRNLGHYFRYYLYLLDRPLTLF